MLNKIKETLNENDSQLELITIKRKKTMTKETNTKEKRINLFNVTAIIKLSNELAERGETLTDIEFVDNFKFDKEGDLYLHGRIYNIKKFSVSIDDENKSICRSYKATETRPFSLEDFKISNEFIRYID